MTALIKSDAAPGRIRAFTIADDLAKPVLVHASPSATASSESSPSSVLDADRRSLREKLDAAESALALARDDIEQARRAGEAEGREAERAAISDRDAKAIDALKKGVGLALEKLSTELASLERLAPALAKVALERVLGVDAPRASLLARILERQCKALERQAVLHVDVSTADFPEAKALDRLRTEAGRPAFDFRARDDLPSGACSIKLRLGEIDVGVDQQWSALAAALAEMTAP